MADDLPLGRIFQLRLFRLGLLHRAGGEGTVAGFLPAWAHHIALAGGQLAGIHTPLCSGGGHDHLAGAGAGLTQVGEPVANGRRTTGQLRAENAVDVGRGCRRYTDLQIIQVDIQLFGDQHGHRGVNTLTHFGTGSVNADLVIFGNTDPRIGRE